VTDENQERKVQLKEPTPSPTPPGGSPLLDQQPFAGVNRRPHTLVLIEHSIAPASARLCDGCEQLDQGNDRCALFNMTLGRDYTAECGHGWFRTTQCQEAEEESKLYHFKTNGIERGAARTGALFRPVKPLDRGACGTVNWSRCVLPNGHDGDCRSHE
jgi:hypothetical protein